METRDGRGEYGRQIGERNKEEVKAFLEKNPSCTVAECMMATGFSFLTVRKHLDAIMLEEDGGV